MFLLADFAMMSSLCFIWKSILECLQMLSCHFLIVFHLKLANVYTETTVDNMEQQLQYYTGKKIAWLQYYINNQREKKLSRQDRAHIMACRQVSREQPLSPSHTASHPEK